MMSKVSQESLSLKEGEPDRYVGPEAGRSHPLEPASSVCAPCCAGQEGKQLAHCPDDGAPLEYDAQSQEWVCQVCGVAYRSEEIIKS